MRKRSSFIVVLCLIMLLVGSSVASAAADAEQRFAIFTTIQANMKIEDNKLSCGGSATLGDYCEIDMTVELYQLSSSGWGDPIETWTAHRDRDNMISKAGHKTVGSGSFRVKVTITATNDDGVTETLTRYDYASN